MFLGEYQHTLDAKGRVSLPARFRGELTGKIVVAKGLDNCLYVYPAEEYKRFTDSLTEGSDFDPRKRQLRRFFMSGAWETELDSAGRVSVPPSWREHAGLARDVAVTGNGSRIEIWDSEAWERYNDASTERIEDLASELASAGLL
jgi:MraZ protein